MGGAPADGSQGYRTHELSYDYGVGGVIELLKHRTCGYGQKIGYQLFDDASFGKVIFNAIHFDIPHK